jgi:DNA-binding GntR family transcriptional regulator
MGPTRNLTDTIYESLRRDILESTLRPGEKLSEVRLAKRFNVSRAPIRDAIARLQQENLVLVKPQVGTLIMPVSSAKARNVLQIRLLLESYAAEVAALHLTPEDREILAQRFEKLARINKAGEDKKQQLFETDKLLHKVIWERCGNPEIKNIINRYRDEMQRIRRSTVDLGDRLTPSEMEMKEIYRALLAKNPIRARKAMVTHLLKIRKAIETILPQDDETALAP